MAERRWLTLSGGPVWAQCEPESLNEKVLRYLNTGQDALSGVKPLRHRQKLRNGGSSRSVRGERQREGRERESERGREAQRTEAMDGGRELEVPTLDDPNWEDQLEASSTTDVAITTPSKRPAVHRSPNPKVLVQAMLEEERSLKEAHYGRPRGIYSAGGSSSASGSSKLLGDFEALNIRADLQNSLPVQQQYTPQPQSPVSPGDVRFSWDFSDGGEHGGMKGGAGAVLELRRSRDSVMRMVVDGSEREGENVGSTFGDSEEETRQKNESLSAFGMWTSGNKRQAAQAQIRTPERNCKSSCQQNVEEPKEAWEHMLSNREPAPYRAASRPSAVERRTGVLGFGSLGHEEQQILPPQRLFTRNRGAGDPVMEALVGQLVNAKDAVSCGSVAERVLLFQASALTQQFAALADGAMGSSHGFELLNLSGLFVQREMSLLKALDKLRVAFPHLLPVSGQSGEELSAMLVDTPIRVACIGQGPGCLGLGLLLLFAWISPQSEVEMNCFGGGEGWQGVADAVSLAGIKKFSDLELFDIMSEEGALKGYSVVVISFVVVRAMKGRKPNDWALFWRDLHGCTDSSVVVVFCDDFKQTNTHDFMPPQYVQSTDWECAVFEASEGQRTEEQHSFYVAWKPEIPMEQ